MNLNNLECCFCGRKVEKVVSDTIDLKKASRRTKLEVMFMTYTNHLICARCSTIYVIPLIYDGYPVIEYVHEDKKLYGKTRLLKKRREEVVDLEKTPSVVKWI